MTLKRKSLQRIFSVPAGLKCRKVTTTQAFFRFDKLTRQMTLVSVDGSALLSKHVLEPPMTGAGGLRLDMGELFAVRAAMVRLAIKHNIVVVDPVLDLPKRHFVLYSSITNEGISPTREL
jgi:hypothetical protein